MLWGLKRNYDEWDDSNIMVTEMSTKQETDTDSVSSNSWHSRFLSTNHNLFKTQSHYPHIKIQTYIGMVF